MSESTEKCELPTARDAAAGMLLRQEWDDAASALATGAWDAEDAARAIRSGYQPGAPMMSADVACVAALEALARGDLRGPADLQDLLATIERLAHERITQADAAAAREASFMDECGALASAIANAAKRAGIYNGEVALRGPDLILLTQNMAEEIERLRRRDDEWQAATRCSDPDRAWRAQ